MSVQESGHGIQEGPSDEGGNFVMSHRGWRWVDSGISSTREPAGARGSPVQSPRREGMGVLVGATACSDTRYPALSRDRACLGKRKNLAVWIFHVPASHFSLQQLDRFCTVSVIVEFWNSIEHVF